MRDPGVKTFAAPWERLRAGFDPEADKPTLVQTAEEMLATERAPRTVPARQVSESLLELETRLDGATTHIDPRLIAEAAANGLPAGAVAEGELEAAYDDAWSPAPRRNEPSHIGQLIDNRYVVESLIARGGMGIVYRCRHKLIDRRFAVKIIRSTMAHLPDAPRRFLMEAKAASAIGNEHIIDVVDYGTLADGSAYLVMELLEGVPLSDVIAKHETLPVARITAIAAQVCEGLRAAHDAGIVHRDLKPENIFLTNRKASDFVKILDFGIAKMAQSGEALTKKGLIVGTPHYMSPEQAAGATVDARGDIYSLGVILYELATGRVPFDAVHYMAVLAKHMTEPPPPFHSLSLPATPPPDFESIVLRCLAKRPEQRFQTMTDVLGELERLSARLRSASRSSLETLLPAAPLATLEDTTRGTGHSVPAPAARTVATPRKRRGLGLLVPALGLAVLTGISVFRIQSAEELPVARAAGARDRIGAAELDDGAPLATTTARLASMPAGEPGAASAEDDDEASAASGDDEPPNLTAGAEPGDEDLASRGDVPDDVTAPLTKMEPLMVELAPGKSVEIEARTRVSLRLTEEERAAAEAASAQRSPARAADEPRKSGAARARRGTGDGADAASSRADSGKRGKGRSSRSGGGKGASKSERSSDELAPSELMNPWPSP